MWWVLSGDRLSCDYGKESGLAGRLWGLEGLGSLVGQHHAEDLLWSGGGVPSREIESPGVRMLEITVF